MKNYTVYFRIWSIQLTALTKVFIGLFSVVAFVLALWIWDCSSSRAHVSCVQKGHISFCVSGTDFLTIPLSKEIKTHHFQNCAVIALRSEHVGDAIADLMLKNQMEKEPIAAFVQSKNEDEYLILIDKAGELSVSSVNGLIKSSLVAIDEGGRGIGIAIKAPNSTNDGSLYFKVWNSS